MKIALAGNPNSGKTTLFNAITGKSEYVGNWAGVTVEKKEADLKAKYSGGNRAVKIIDLPGAYSISPFTGEEAITRDFVLDEAPNVIINIVDGANFERSLFFTTQLLELNIPLVVAINKEDIIRKRGNIVDIDKLSRGLNCPVVSTTANFGHGLKKLMQIAILQGEKGMGQEPIELTQFEDENTINEVKSAENNDIARQKYISDLMKTVLVKNHDTSKISISDKVDRIVAHKYIGLPIFFLVMWAVYAFSIEGLGGYVSGYLNDTFFGEIVPNALNTFFESVHLNPLLQALIVDGAIGGVGAVIGFLPLIMVLFFCLALLEDSGYMSRVAVLMDRYFKKIGLSGKSIIPMIVGSGCAIPGVMATRTIEDDNERRITTILTPFVPCGAKLPIITLFSIVFFPNSSWVGPSVYLLAFVLIIIGGILLKKLFVYESTTSFILELPEYKIPSLKHAFSQMLDKAKGFIIKASTIILVMNTLVWFMQAYGFNLQPAVMQDSSILAVLGGFIAPIFIPLGLVGWQLAAASITGFIAKENVVATFAILLAAASEEALSMPGGVLSSFFNPVTAYAFLAFNLFTPPCFAAIGAMRSEMGDRKWLFRGLSFQLSVGFLVAMLITQIGTPIFYGKIATGFIPSIFVLIFYCVLLVYLFKRADGKRELIEE